jgi:hypothetical protein
MQRLPLLFYIAGAASCLAQSTLPLFQKDKLRVLILSGRNNHDWRTTTPLIRQQLVDSGKFDVRVNEEPMGIGAQTLAAYHAILLDYDGPRWGAVTEKAVEEFVSSGKGMVVIHAAAYPFHGLNVLGDKHVRTGIFEPPWEEYAKMIGCRWSDEEPKTGHGKRHVFTVKVVDRDHPVGRDLPETMRADDELYHNMRMRPEAKVLATAFDAREINGTGKDEPILWTVAYGKGRVFHNALGHDVEAMRQPAFALPVVRGSEWAAAGN